MKEKLTREQALTLHRQMWEDMQLALGDNPSRFARNYFKYSWIKIHFPDEIVLHNCFLCEYNRGRSCDLCPIDWGYDPETGFCGCELGLHCWSDITISELLALPERRKGA